MSDRQTHPAPCQNCGLVHSPFVVCHEEEHQRAYHPSELPEHMKAAVRATRMDPKHDYLNGLVDEPPQDAK